MYQSKLVVGTLGHCFHLDVQEQHQIQETSINVVPMLKVKLDPTHRARLSGMSFSLLTVIHPITISRYQFRVSTDIMRCDGNERESCVSSLSILMTSDGALS